MKRIRIKNDISIRWHIITNGEAMSLEGRELRLTLKDDNGYVRHPEFGVESNVVSLSFAGADQRNLGVYTLILEDTTGGKLITIDHICAFALVAHTEDESRGEKSVELTSYVEVFKGGISDNYEELTHKPSINGTTLVGDLSSQELGIASRADIVNVLDLLNEQRKDIEKREVLSASVSANVLTLTMSDGSTIRFSGGEGGTGDYEQLTNRPSIEGVTLSGNKSASDLKLMSAEEGDALDKYIKGVETRLSADIALRTIASITSDGDMLTITRTDGSILTFKGGRRVVLACYTEQDEKGEITNAYITIEGSATHLTYADIMALLADKSINVVMRYGFGVLVPTYVDGVKFEGVTLVESVPYIERIDMATSGEISITEVEVADYEEVTLMRQLLFNVQDALRITESNMATAVGVPTEFNAEVAYEVGDVVYKAKENTLYHFIKAHQGEWADEDVEVGYIGGDMGKAIIANIKKIQEIELFKYPNATIKGELTISHGQVSGFARENYLVLPFALDLAGKGWELNVAFRAGENVTTAQNIIGSNFCVAMFVQNGQLTTRISTSGTSWEISKVSSFGIEANKIYYVRLTHNLLQYALFYSTDGKEYTSDWTEVNPNSPAEGLVYMGVGMNFNNPFGGIIDLNKCSLLINNQHYWEGMDDAGLATRLATDLSNIDEEGISKVKELAEVTTLHTLEQKVSDLETSKDLGVIVVGNLDIQGSQVSGFGANKYLMMPRIINFGSDKWQLDFQFTTGEDVQEQQNIIDSHFGLALAIRNGHIVVAMSHTGIEWDMGEHEGRSILSANTSYYVRMTFDGIKYEVFISTDGKTFTPYIEVDNDLPLKPVQIYIGKSLDNAHIFKGSIYLYYASLSIAGTIVWTGTLGGELKDKLRELSLKVDGIEEEIGNVEQALVAING